MVTLTTIRILTDTGVRITLPEQTDEVMSDYAKAYKDEASSPGQTVSFARGPESWTILPIARIVAIQAVPDLVDAPPDDVVPVTGVTVDNRGLSVR
jgi:hypothetical protein